MESALAAVLQAQERVGQLRAEIAGMKDINVIFVRARVASGRPCLGCKRSSFAPSSDPPSRPRSAHTLTHRPRWRRSA